MERKLFSWLSICWVWFIFVIWWYSKLVIQNLKATWMIIECVCECFIVLLTYELCLLSLYDALFPEICSNTLKTKIQVVFKEWVTVIVGNDISLTKTQQLRLLSRVIAAYCERHAKLLYIQHTSAAFFSFKCGITYSSHWTPEPQRMHYGTPLSTS